MQLTNTKRPRNVSAAQAAAILYGDWGTSKAYVIGLAFALAGYSSFWLILAVSVLMACVGINYMAICRANPMGGGVYTSARKRSETLALAAAFFLVADYLITASLSALSCFMYLGVDYPVYWSVGAIFCIGLLNYFGPKHSGNVALIFAVATVCVVIMLGILAIPYIPNALASVAPLPDAPLTNWTHFVGIIIALSGVEAVANTTGVMQLDPGSTEDNPQIAITSKRALLWVMIEVCFFTAFFGLMVNALPGLTLVDGNISAPDHPHIRDHLLRYMGEYFVSHYWDGKTMALIVSSLIGGVFAILLLSAVNTALVALVSLVFVMSKDGELPQVFQKLTPFGVPFLPLVIATLIPMTILIFVHDIAQLANLYAVGFVGAIATNLGVNASDKTTPMKPWERYLMWSTFVVMASIEITLLIDKPQARMFVFTIVAIGIILRMLVVERRQHSLASKKAKEQLSKYSSLFEEDSQVPLHEGALLCAVRSVGKTLNFALQEAKQSKQPLYILYIRNQKVITPEDQERTWLDDEEACKIFDYAIEHAPGTEVKFFYIVSDVSALAIVHLAEQLRISRLIVGRPRHNLFIQMLQGNVIREIDRILPGEIDLLVIS